MQLEIQKYLFDIKASIDSTIQIDDVIIWGIVSRQLPLLNEQIQNLLKE